MARREALRELQQRLAERLQVARTREPVQSWLAVECAGRGFLLPLYQAGEIFPLLAWQPVPYTRPWFLGVANLRGSLHGVVDLAAFLGIGAWTAAAREHGQLVALGASLGVNAALLVDRLAGLRRIDDLTAVPADADAPAFAPARWRENDGRVWQELNLAALAADDHFSRIGV